ncbi:MAG TPA: 50S ribosomal protein L18e [Thermoplasmata archaeon]|nr:50S ribosomal protein L18e [Thermoplasmata archaeon]
MKPIKKTNPELQQLIQLLRKKSHEHQAPIWKDLAKRLGRSRKEWPSINVSRLEKHLSEGQVVVVPGKLLGSGELTKPFTVGAFKFSKKAREKIIKAGGTCVSIEELAEKNPKGSNIRIME